MGAFKKAVIGAAVASSASAHSIHKRGTVPVDGTVWTSCLTTGTVALTFDDGPYQYSQKIVDQLTAAGHRATFFQNGANYGDIYSYGPLLQSMIAGGHQIGSHTWAHADLTTLDAAGITSQMQQLETAHLALIGKAPTYMRPPYLSLNDLAVTTLKGLGYKIISVDIDTQDWAEGPIGQIQQSINWYEGNQTAGGTLSLNHDVYEPTADTFVPAIIAYLDGKGLKSVPVGECIGDDAANWYRGGSASASSALPSATASKAPSSASSAAPGKSDTPKSSGSAPAGPGKSDTPKPSGGDTSKPSASSPSGPGKPAESGKPSGDKPSGSPPSGPGKPTESGKPSGGKPSGDKPSGSMPSGSAPGKPSESGKPDYGYSPSTGPSKGPACGGDTEKGHGAYSGTDAIPKHAGERNQVWKTNGTSTGSSGSWGSGSGSSGSGSASPAYGDKPSSVQGGKAMPSYTGAVYTGGAATLTGSAMLIGAAVAALFL